MITIDDKLYITKEVNRIVVKYAKTVIIRKLLLEFSYDSDTEEKIVSSKLESTNFYNGDLNSEVEIGLKNFINFFIKRLNKEEITAMYFWTINNLYIEYIDTIDDILNNKDSKEVYDFKFGRKLAHKLYEPESTELANELFSEIKKLLINYASEFDLSAIDEATFEDIEYVINSYTS